jgi:hypothetical protein
MSVCGQIEPNRLGKVGEPTTKKNWSEKGSKELREQETKQVRDTRKVTASWP